MPNTTIFAGTGRRVLTTDQVEDTRDQYISDFEQAALIGSFSQSSEDDRSDGSGTALGLGQRTLDTATASQMLDYSDDLSTTPGLHTAALQSFTAALAVPAAPAREPAASEERDIPHTLAVYLASTLSSPDVRSPSCDSIASFPTDTLSEPGLSATGDEVSDSAWDGHSETGYASSAERASSRVYNTNKGLVMPKLRPEAVGHRHANARTVQDTNRKRVLIVGGTRKYRRRGRSVSYYADILVFFCTERQQRQLSAALSDHITNYVSPRRGQDDNKTQSHLTTASLASSTASFQDLYLSSGDFVSDAESEGEGNPPESIEIASSLASAAETCQEPFVALQSMLQPSAGHSSAAYQAVLKTLLSHVNAVHVCFWLLPVSKDQLTHIISSNRNCLRELCNTTLFVPITVSAHFDPLDQILEGPVRTALGISDKGTLISLSEQAKILSFSRCLATSRLRTILAGTDIAGMLDGKYKDWVAQADQAKSVKHTFSGADLSAAQPQSTSSMQSSSAILGSLSTSAIASLPAPSASIGSSSALSQDESESGPPPSLAQSWHSWQSRPQRSLSGACFDPLHIPSLVRLAGLNLSASFVTLRSTISGFISAAFHRYASSRDRVQTQQVPGDPNDGRATSGVTLPSSIRAFCSWNNAAAGDNTTGCLIRCHGIFIAAAIVSVALFFS